MNQNIQHNPKQRRFEITMNGLTAYMSYRLDQAVLEYNHTIVPKALGGQGLGTELVKYGLAYARVHHLKVKPTCPFVAALIEKNPVYQDLLESI
ncbi:GNAT family N-acetyltransferase [Marinicella meishanensis]|uniref:GNAT family N-acetyltransferase n=1 Tax=Marinicella meishanensis TaxID=2873263 RepID=UPI001CBD9B58|nr:GNAT family N-acetyltransferase [Marinicella sp. NBU2979]